MTYAKHMTLPPAPVVAPAARPARDPSQCRPGTLAGELRVALVRSTRRLRMERSSEDITDGQYSVLAHLSSRGAMTPGDLAERDHVQPPSMTRTVTRLVEMGLVARGEHPTDRRQVLVTVTEAGEREVRETRRRRDAWLSQRLAALTPSQRSTLAEAVEILREIASS
jgi:DNA-binding MarR family transcriptional regulator